MSPIIMSALVLLSLVSLFGFVFVPTAQAVCPVCTAAVIGGLGISRFIGIDDSVSGVWVGGVILSSSFWFAEWVAKRGYFKKISSQNMAIITATSLYLLTFVPMYMTGFIGHPINKLFGLDKLVVGTLVGSVAFLLGMFADKKVREIQGKQFFHFQKVAFPVSMLIISSVVLYFVTK